MSRRTIRKATTAEVAQTKHALLCVLVDEGVASTDDAHRRYELPAAVDQRCWGSIVAGLLAAGVIHRVGDRHTSRLVAHGRRIGRYVLTDRNQAIVLRDRLAAAAACERPRQMVLPGIDD